MPPTHHPSGLAVPIRLPPPLGRLRRHWDRAARAGAQPHVTILFPFLPTSALSIDVRVSLASIAAAVEPVDVTFRRVRRFDEGVVWIEPEPAEPFRRLTAAVVERWPDHPPYGGLFDELIPHLTVVEADGDEPPLGTIEAVVAGHLPFTARADRLESWRQDPDGRWRQHWRLRLGRVRPRRAVQVSADG
jgi:2'-5' RNA ligase